MDEAEMSFLDHLEVLRWHVIRIVAVMFLLAIVIYSFRSYVFDYIVFGPTQTDFVTYKTLCNISESLCFAPPELKIISVKLGEQFITAIKTALLLGFVLSFPYVFWEIWRFVKPGLYDNEKKVTRGITLICTLLFYLGVLFGYFFISPFAVKFLGGFDLGQIAANEVSVESFVNYMVMFTVPTGIIFELPVVVYFLSKLGIVSPAFMRKYRRHAFIIFLLLAAIITPPDAITQFMIGIPVYLLYEVSIRISDRVYKQQEQSASTTSPSKTA